MKKIRQIAVAAMLLLSATMLIGSVNAQTAGNSSDDDLKLMALDGLRGADASVAVPQLEKVLAGNGSVNLKKRALSILAHEDSTQAREALARFAKTQKDPVLQAEAVRQLGVAGGADAMKTLAEIYASSTDAGMKRSILRSYMNAGDKDRLLAAAQSEKDPSVRIEAIRLLGAMGSRDALMQLYKGESTDDGKIQILQGLRTTESRDSIAQIAMTEASVEVRRAAIRDIGTMGRGTQTGPELVSLYAKEKDPTVRKEILRALANQDDAKDLIDVARKESDADLKVYAVRVLSQMRSKEAQDYMMEILSK